MAKADYFDLVVIGAGSGGLVAAEYAAKLGARVALIEKQPGLGGECLHSGCVPSKALLYIAQKISQRRAYGEKIELQAGLEEALAYAKDRISVIEKHKDNDTFYEKLGVKIFHQAAKFGSMRQIELSSGTRLTFKKCIVATGSSPFVPPIDGLDSVDFMTNETMFEPRSFPKRMAILGGGPIGVEMASAWSQLGTEVTILQSNERLLPVYDPFVTDYLTKHIKTTGVSVATSSQVVKINQKRPNDPITIFLKGGNLAVEALLVATGRTPNIASLNLSAADIHADKRGIVVNDRFQTSNRHVYALGDCTDHPKFTHTAAEAAASALTHALFGVGGKADISHPPSVTFSTPEIAHVGHTRQALMEEECPHELHTIDYGDIDKPIAENQAGFISVITTPRGRILGAYVVGKNAGELIGYFALMIRHKRRLKDLASAVYPYPTYSTGFKQLSADFTFAKINRYQKLLSLARKLRR